MPITYDDKTAHTVINNGGGVLMASNLLWALGSLANSGIDDLEVRIRKGEQGDEIWFVPWRRDVVVGRIYGFASDPERDERT